MLLWEDEVVGKITEDYHSEKGYYFYKFFNLWGKQVWSFKSYSKMPLTDLIGILTSHV